MVAFKSFLTFLTLTLFSLATAAPFVEPASGVAVKRDNGSCDQDWSGHVNKIKTDVATIAVGFGEIIEDITQATSKGIQLPQDVLQRIGDVKNLVVDVVQLILSTNFTCLKGDLIQIVISAAVQLANCAARFLTVLLGWKGAVSPAVFNEVFDVVLAIPKLVLDFVQSLLKCPGIEVFGAVLSPLVGLVGGALKSF